MAFGNKNPLTNFEAVWNTCELTLTAYQVCWYSSNLSCRYILIPVIFLRLTMMFLLIFLSYAVIKYFKMFYRYAIPFPISLARLSADHFTVQLSHQVASQRIGSQVWYYQSTKEKGIQWSVDHTEELNCWNML